MKDEAALIHILRTYRCREMIRIAFRDLAGWNNLSETVTDLSGLAEACLEHASLFFTAGYLKNWECPQPKMAPANNWLFWASANWEHGS